VHIDIWSDIACPWCYIGKRHLEEALADFPHDVEIRWHSFELDPRADAEPDDRDYAERLADKYGVSAADAQRMLDEMTGRAADAGLEYRFDRAHKANTFDAHRLLHLAWERGVQDELKEALFRAMFTEGRRVDDVETLVAVAAAAGLDADEARRTLESGAFADAVRADEAQAASLGITAVPFFVIDRRYGVPGAQPADVLLRVLESAWQERSAA
jgi:predicted DsbA family dithiol-disulfide isomerase